MLNVSGHFRTLLETKIGKDEVMISEKKKQWIIKGYFFRRDDFEKKSFAQKHTRHGLVTDFIACLRSL
jgi:hypothetical protein